MDGVEIKSDVALGMDLLGGLTKRSSSVLSTVSQSLIGGIGPQEEETNNKNGNSEGNDLTLDIFLDFSKMTL